MSAMRDILFILGNRSGGYRLMRARMQGNGWQPKELRGSSGVGRREYSDAAMRVALSRLKKKGFVKNERSLWKITQRGKEYALTRFFPQHSKKISEKKPKEIIIIFDIPERERSKRQWLRMELRNLGFHMLQQSAWFGPAPVPEEFIDSLKDLGLLRHMKFFEAKEANVI